MASALSPYNNHNSSSDRWKKKNQLFATAKITTSARFLNNKMSTLNLIQILLVLVLIPANAMHDISIRRKQVQLSSPLLSKSSPSSLSTKLSHDCKSKQLSSSFNSSFLLVHKLRGGASEVVDEDKFIVSKKGDKKNLKNEQGSLPLQQGKETILGDTENDDEAETMTETEEEEEEESEIESDVTSDDYEVEEENQIQNSNVDIQENKYDENEEEEEEEVNNVDDISTTKKTSGQVQPQTDDENENDDNEDTSTHTTSKSFQDTIDLKQNEASSLRIQGKQLHDDGDFQSAAKTFQKAASELDFVISIYQQNLMSHNGSHGSHSSSEHHHYLLQNDEEDDDSEKENNENNHLEEQQQEQQQQQQLSHSDLLRISEERATCRLHEALCHLKNKNYAESIISCTDVLMDGVQVVPLTEEVDDDNDNDKIKDKEEDEEDDNSTENHQAVIVRISPSGDDSDSQTAPASSTTVELSPAIRARAYHRRAKARLALGDATGALDDARSAAFLGDRNAVALYGKLMRNSGGNMNIFGESDSSSGSDIFGGGGGGDMESLFSSASPLGSLFGDSSNESGGLSSPSSLGMLSSLLGSQGDGASAPNPFGALGGLGSLLDGSGAMNGSGDGGGGMDSLAKSVLSSLAKKIDDESTQEMVCNYLNSVDSSQISSLSSMANVQLGSSTVDRIVGFANGVTPKKMRKTIKLVKRIVFVGNILRKIVQLIGKYKHLLILVLLIAWVKSAILRPVIVKTKVVKKAAEAVSKAAFII